MVINFTKMHGIGNDFVVIDAFSTPIQLTAEQVRFLADRHFGVGCDQLLLVERPIGAGVDFRYRIFNADGGEVQQCGNGARCFARFVRDQGLTEADEIRVETAAGLITLYLEDDGQVRVNMGVPRFEPQALPMHADGDQLVYELDLGGDTLRFGALSMGNPHMVMQVDDVATAAVDELGPLLERHELFPERVNVGFMQVVSPQAIRLRVYERGAAETLACGTGACAAAVVGRRWGLLEEEVSVELPGGVLSIRWQGEGRPVWMIGPAQRVFDGRIEL